MGPATTSWGSGSYPRAFERPRSGLESNTTGFIKLVTAELERTSDPVRTGQLRSLLEAVGRVARDVGVPVLVAEVKKTLGLPLG